MEDITSEKALYVIHYYGHLLTRDEQKASAYYMITSKHEDAPDRIKMYLEMGRITNEPRILEYLNGGYNQFVVNCAKRILRESPDKVFFNYCPVCGELARTPVARQCRFCGHDWH